MKAVKFYSFERSNGNRDLGGSDGDGRLVPVFLHEVFTAIWGAHATLLMQIPVCVSTPPRAGLPVHCITTFCHEK